MYAVVASGSGRLITGTNGDDTLIGSSGTDLIKGNGGYDGINGCNREMSSKVQFFEINQFFIYFTSVVSR